MIIFSAKIKLYFSSAPSTKSVGPQTLSKHDFIQLSFRKGGQEQVTMVTRLFTIVLVFF